MKNETPFYLQDHNSNLQFKAVKNFINALILNGYSDISVSEKPRKCKTYMCTIKNTEQGKAAYNLIRGIIIKHFTIKRWGRHSDRKKLASICNQTYIRGQGASRTAYISKCERFDVYIWDNKEEHNKRTREWRKVCQGTLKKIKNRLIFYKFWLE